MGRTCLRVTCAIFATAFAIRAIAVDGRQFREADSLHAAQLRSNDFAYRANARFSLLRPRLPDQGEVGYLAPTTGLVTTDEGYYLMAQYTLAPLIVRKSIKEHLVIANFPNDGVLQGAIQGTPLALVRAHDHPVSGLAVLENLNVPATPSHAEAAP